MVVLHAALALALLGAGPQDAPPLADVSPATDAPAGRSESRWGTLVELGGREWALSLHTADRYVPRVAELYRTITGQTRPASLA